MHTAVRGDLTCLPTSTVQHRSKGKSHPLRPDLDRSLKIISFYFFTHNEFLFSHRFLNFFVVLWEFLGVINVGNKRETGQMLRSERMYFRSPSFVASGFLSAGLFMGFYNIFSMVFLLNIL